MEFLNFDPNIERLAPTDTRILDLRSEPYPDGKRLKVIMDLTPFREKPTLELNLLNEAGDSLASASIIEPVSWKLEVVLHIRTHGSTVEGSNKLELILSYPDLGEIDRRHLILENPSI